MGTGLQEVNYAYNIRGWMTQINDPANLGTTDLFGYRINYNQIQGLPFPNSDFSNLEVQPKYNGNIAEVSWKTLTEENEPLKRYGYVYDGLNRLQAGFYQKAGSENAQEYFEKIDYDLNGNISRLKRSAELTANSPTALLIDNLKYDYTGNRLTKVTEEQIGNGNGYPYLATPNTITYDDNGNMSSHKDRQFGSIEYNILNLPNKMKTSGTKLIKTHANIYRADGVKVTKNISTSSEMKTTEYLDGFQYSFYTGSQPPVTPTGLQFIPTSEGYYDFTTNSYIYNYTDHLGNVRLSYTDTNKDGIIQPRSYMVQQCDGPFNPPFEIPNCISTWKPGEIVEVNNYYPFGLLHNYTETTQNAYQYKYNGKELQETGMYDYGARFYMPDLGRWGVVDPLAEVYRRHSVYSYAVDNPIRFIDPDGMKIEYANDSNKSKKENRELRREFKRHQNELNRQSEEARNNWNTLVKSKNIHTIHLNEINNETGKNKENLTVPKSGYTPENGGGTDIYLDLTKTTAEGVFIGTPIIGIGHEEGHAFRFDTGKVDGGYQGNALEPNYLNNIIMHDIGVKQTEEKEASHIENIIRAQIDPTGTKIPLRKTFENADSFYLEPFTNKLRLNQTTLDVIKPGYDYYKQKK